MRLLGQFPLIKKIFSKPFIIIFCILGTFPINALSYPKAWWEPVDRNSAKSWEILPQDANQANHEVILSKRTELGILSNFAATAFNLDGKKYASLEGFWQMMKYPDPKLRNDPRNKKGIAWKHTRAEVSKMSGFKAKYAGQATKENYRKLGIKWISYNGARLDYKGKEQLEHLMLIERASLAKIKQNNKARRILLATKGLRLMADHIQKPDVPPAYRYFDILMRIRENLHKNTN